ncbi:MAG TPA: SAM-dependent methyltransferase [Burkholderiales bacterium]|nr:SAM-dependent methyltransferase [Burkholderiales bacterium]
MPITALHTGQRTSSALLPAPDPDALAASRELSERIASEIRAAGGWISFARYMELALYAPGLGYYSGGARKLGRDGDFVTAPEISPLFGRALARQIAQVLETTQGEVLELGAGSGALAMQLLPALDRLGCPPRRYFILELSAQLRERQRDTLAERAPQWLEKVAWLESLPDLVNGVVFGNEVLDAVTVHLAAWRDDGIFERGVALGEAGFVWRERPAAGHLREAATRLPVAAPYVSEVGLGARALVATAAQRLARGALLFIDYGFGRGEYYHPQRAQGTLMCHYRHRAHDDPFFLPGLQDITAHVDFSAVAGAAREAGCALSGYTTQAQFLLNCGITDLLAETPADEAARYLPQAAAVQRLLSPAEMGELFKAIALTRGIDAPLLGFRHGDKARLL